MNWLRNMNNDPGENGIDLAKWMVERGCIPARIVIHTWNGWGGRAIADCFSKAGHDHAEIIFWNGSEAHLKRVYAQ